MTETADRYRGLSRRFADLVAAVPADKWDASSPCDEWTALGVVQHVLDVHGMFEKLAGRALDVPTAGPSTAGAAFAQVQKVVQADLDDPERAATAWDGYFGTTNFAESVDRFVCFDLVVHGWDRARAAGLDDTIDPLDVERVQAMVDRMGDTMRANGVIKQPVEPAPDASAQDRLLCALGRDPRAGQPSS